MTALPSISQIKYTINKTDYTCYTNYENRRIAELFAKGERDSLLLNTCKLQVINYKNITLTQQTEIDTLKIKIDKLFKDAIESNNKLIKVSEQNSKLKKNNKIFGGIGVGLLIILILK